MTLDAFPAPSLEFGAGLDPLRERVRAWVAGQDDPPAPAAYAERIVAQVVWQRDLHAAGFVGLSWPERFGGSGLEKAAEAVLAEELASAGTTELINRIAVYMIGPTLMDLGSEEQQARFLPAMLDASELWCQGFSEPEAGSDLANVRTWARRDGDEWVVNGQKVWTSRANIARWCALLVRTDREQQRHRGLSMLIVDMNSPGVTVRPLPQVLDEPHFNEVFLDDVRVPADNIIAAPGDGWKVAMQMLSYERGLFVLERQIRLRRRLDDLADALIRRGDDADSSVREHVGKVYVDLALLESQVYRTLEAQRTDSLRPGATSVDKLLLSHAYQALFTTAADLLGPDVARGMNDWTHDLLESRGVSIYGGTTEVQHGIVARQLLGLRKAG